tara:strand:+ start:552 stop:953 length:402 start_codon:yes stop_codon:yes gene_type:complete
MIRYIKYLKGLFSESKNSETDEAEGLSNYIKEEDCACRIELRLDKENGDFNVIVDIKDESSATAESLGLLMYLLNSGGLSEYITSAYQSWAGENIERQGFAGEVLFSWISNKESFSEEYDRLAVKPSEVFKNV